MQGSAALRIYSLFPLAFLLRLNGWWSTFYFLANAVLFIYKGAFAFSRGVRSAWCARFVLVAVACSRASATCSTLDSRSPFDPLVPCPRASRVRTTQRTSFRTPTTASQVR